MSIVQQYNQEVKPTQEDKKWVNTRANKDTRYAHFKIHREIDLNQKERWAIDLLKMAFQRVDNPVVSCSFGIDSVVIVYLARKALIELGKNPSDIDIVWNDTANEFQDVRKYQKHLTELWDLRLKIYKPEKTLKHIINDNGGVTTDYFFARKGDRSKSKQPLSEKCCGTLKHKPMKKAIKENNWDLMVVGLRGDEANQRKIAGLRDGEFFYSSGEWKSLVVRPILWWLEGDIWNYVEQENIPYNNLYTRNLIQKYPFDNKLQKFVNENKAKLDELGLDSNLLLDRQIQTVNRPQATLLKKNGFKLFTPRTGWNTAV